MEHFHNMIDTMLNEGILMDYINADLDKSITDKLFAYQVSHVQNLVRILLKDSVIIDGSDTGTGKTFAISAVAAQLKLKPFVIAPKTVLSVWNKIMNIFNVTPYTIINYEAIRSGYWFNNNKKEICPFLTIKNNNYVWSLPTDCILIFDEAHKCKNYKSAIGKLFIASKPNNHKLAILSATISDKISDFASFGYVLNFYQNIKNANNWINSKILYNSDHSCLAKTLFPFKGSRMRIEELGDNFPTNQISVDCYNLSDALKMKFNTNYQKLKNLKPNNLTDILYHRKILELVKVDILVELACEYLDNHCAVVIFVNFIDTVKAIRKKINANSITGDTSCDRRNKIIKLFQSDKINCIVTTAATGGQSISLHDTHGNVRRVSLISPSFSSLELIQCLGRIYRSGTKTPVLQRIILCSDTYEETICEKLRNKLKFLSKINDNDLSI